MCDAAPVPLSGGESVILRTIFLATMIVATTFGQTVYYFDFDGGNDSNAGTQAAPFKTITKLNATAKSGDVCMLQAGDTFVVRLRPAEPGITVQSYGTANNGRATITSTADNQSAWGEHPALTFKDLELTGDAQGLYLQNDVNGLMVVGVDAHTNSENGVNMAPAGGNGTTGVGFFIDNNFDDNTLDGIGTRNTFTAYVHGGTISGNDEDGASPHETSTLWLNEVSITGGTTAECVHVFNLNANTYVDRCLITAVDDDCVRVEHQSGNTTGTVYVRNSILVLPASGMAANSAVFHMVGTYNPALVVDSCTVGILNAGANDVWAMRYSASAQSLTVTNTAFYAVDDVDNFYFSSATATLTGVSLAYNRFHRLTTQTTPYDLSTGDVAFAAFVTATGATNSQEVPELGLLDVTDWSTAANVTPTAGSILIDAGIKQAASLDDDHVAGRRNVPWDIGAVDPGATVPPAATATPITNDAGLRVLTDSADFARGWAIGTTPTFLDLTQQKTTLAARLAGGVTKLILSSGGTGAARIALGYGLTPADVSDYVGSGVAGELMVAFPGTWEIWSDRPITSLDAVAGSIVSNIAVVGFE